MSDQAERRAELATALVPVALTLLLLIEPRVAPVVVNDRLALVIDAATTLVAVAVACFAWVHYQEGPDPAALVWASAFLVLAALNALVVLATVARVGSAFGPFASVPESGGCRLRRNW